MKYQFQIDGRGFDSPLRNTWYEAAQDAVNSGHAIWSWTGDGIKGDDSVSIARIQPKGNRGGDPK